MSNLRASLELAQPDPDTTPAQQRAEARQVLADAQDDLAEVRTDLEAQPDSAAKTAADEALAAVGAALTAVDEALRATAPAAAVGLLSFANMHTSLDRAQTALDDAQAKLKQALAADPDDTVASLLTQAQATLSTAQISLLPVLREELAESESGQQVAETERDAAQAARAAAETARQAAEDERDTAQAARQTAETERDAAQAARAEAEAELDRRTVEFGERFDPDDALGRTGPFTSSTGSGVVLTPRLDDAVEFGTTFDPDPDVTTSGFKAMMSDWTVKASPGTYTSGISTVAIRYDPADPARVIAADNPSSAVFPVRGVTFRSELRPVSKYTNADPGPMHPGGDAHTPEQRFAGYNFPRYRAHERLVIQGHDPEPRMWTDTANTRAAQSIPDHPNQWDPWDATPRTSMRYSDDDGLVMEFGGDGVAFGDLTRYFLGECSVSPGASTCTPTGDSTRVNASAGDVTISFGDPTADPWGERAYYWSVEVPSPRRDADGDPLPASSPRADSGGRYELWLSNHAGLDDGGTAAETDDAHRYLDYAAFGIFRFMDELYAGSTQDLRPGRFQILHYGLDAFADTSALPEPITTTFKGKSMGWILLPWRHDAGVDGNLVGDMVRMRADVTLDATIGGANTITGEIGGIEYSPAAGSGLWTNERGIVREGTHILQGKFLLQAGVIAADGTYSGKVVPDPDPHQTTTGRMRAMTFGWSEGSFEGAFYGPRNDLETAGTWWAPATDGHDSHAGIVGSFGATCDSGCN